MGNSGSSSKETRTEVHVKCIREISQAGSNLNGSVEIKVGTLDAKTTFAAFNQGGLIELQLFGSEKTWWAQNHKHDA